MCGKEWLACVVLVSSLLLAAEAGKDEDVSFNHNLHFEEKETGGKFRLESKGRLSEIVNLDKTPSVKRVLCKGNKILVALKKNEPDVKWSPGQLIIGSHGWGCKHNTVKQTSNSIYAKIQTVKRPKKYVVEVITEVAGPLDMFEDASIKVHYEQGRSSLSREKRDKSNFLLKSLNNIDWKAHASSNLTFNTAGVGQPADRVVNVYKQTGKYYPNADTETNTNYADKDFLFTCSSCKGYSDFSYFFELRILKLNRTAEVLKYKMQLELDTHLQHTYSLYTDKEVTLTKEVDGLWHTPPSKILETALIYFKKDLDLPPIMMSVAFSDQANVFLTSSTKDKARYDGSFTLAGKTVISQLYEKGKPVVNDISSYDWTVNSEGQVVDTNATLNATYAIHQRFTVSPLIYWDLKDVDMFLSPPVKVSIRPRVNVVSTTDTVSRCDTSSIRVDSNVSVAETDFIVDAFHKHIWDVKIMSSTAKKMNLLDQSLMTRCHADCHGPVELFGNENDTMETMCGIPSGTILRGDTRFNELHQLWGKYVLYDSDVSQPSWCSTPGQACPNCTQHTFSDTIDKACPERIVNRDLAASLTRLAKLIKAEWPDRKLIIRQAWDEPTSEHPNGRYGDLSVFNEGRAVEVAVTEPINHPSSYTAETHPDILQRLGELGVCASFRYVKLENSEASMCVEKVIQSSKKKRSLLSRKRRSGDVPHDMVQEILENIDVSLQERMHEFPDPPPLKLGQSHPAGGYSMERVCGEPTGRVSQDYVPAFKRLVEFPLNTVTFDREGPEDSWCGVETRHCKPCANPAPDLTDMWSRCMTRTMNMRQAVRLQRLATLTGGKVLVKMALSMNDTGGWSRLYQEGRAAVLSPEPFSSMSMETFTSKAILAGFDFVNFSSSDYIEVCVKPQDGIQTVLVQFPLANLIAVPLPLSEEAEYGYPNELIRESRRIPLFDVSTSSDIISEHFRLSHFQSPGKRFIRLDDVLISLLELAYDNFLGGFYVIPGSGYRPRSVNLDNIDTRHIKERSRFSSGQAVEIKPNTAVTDKKLFDLAIALIRAAKSVRARRIGVGFGCKIDRLYFETRPMVDEDSEPIEVWSSGNDPLFQQLNAIETLVAQGSTVVSASSDSENCAAPVLGEDLFYFNFGLRELGSCWNDSSAKFCADTHEIRYNLSLNLQHRMTRMAGDKRLPREIIWPKIQACVLDTCGGCPDAGQVWKDKVIACTKMILTYLTHASTPFSPLKDKVAFFNTDIDESATRHLACKKICVEKTNIYSLLERLMVATYREDNVEELVFGGADNVSPVLEIVEQELAWRAEGVVTVYIETVKDIGAMRNLIKILMMYNTKVTNIEFRLTPSVDEEDVAIALQRKVEEWSGSVCPQRSRIVTTPYTFEAIPHSVSKRSLEEGKDRNRMKREIRNWEIDWILKN